MCWGYRFRRLPWQPLRPKMPWRRCLGSHSGQKCDDAVACPRVMKDTEKPWLADHVAAANKHATMPWRAVISHHSLKYCASRLAKPCAVYSQCNRFLVLCQPVGETMRCGGVLEIRNSIVPAGGRNHASGVKTISHHSTSSEGMRGVSLPCLGGQGAACMGSRSPA